MVGEGDRLEMEMVGREIGCMREIADALWPVGGTHTLLKTGVHTDRHTQRHLYTQK